MGWTLKKPWENGYQYVTEQVKGSVGPGQDKKIRVQKKVVEPDPVPDP